MCGGSANRGWKRPQNVTEHTNHSPDQSTFLRCHVFIFAKDTREGEGLSPNQGSLLPTWGIRYTVENPEEEHEVIGVYQHESII